MSKKRIAVVVFILLLSLILRLHNYERYPQRGASSDEYTYSFLGVSLLTKGIPISWSNLPVYKHVYNLTINNLYFPIVYPYFDHPPLNGLLVGGWSLLFGQDSFTKIDLKTIRLVPIFLSLISSLLVFLLGTKLYNYKTALWALLIYSTTTIFVMNGRVVFAENLLTQIFLTAVYLFTLWYRNLTDKKALILGILAGLAFWTKEVGIVLFASLFYLFVTEGLKRKYVVIFTVAFFSFFVGYIMYGVYYDWGLFQKVIAAQGNRIVGPQTLQLLMSKPIIVNKIYPDGWYFLGFVTFFASFFDYKRNKTLLVLAGAYFMILIFSLAKEGEMGWYMIPLFPFMSLFTANFLVAGLRQKISWVVFLLLIFVGLSEIRFLYEDSFGLTPFRFRILIFLLFGPSFLMLFLRRDRVANLIGNFWFYLLILGNIFLTYSYVHPS